MSERPTRRDHRSTTVSEREKDVLRLLSDGWRVWEIGIKLGYTKKSMGFALDTIRRKLGSRSTTEAVATALRLRLIE